jgi:hypothetical protein
LNDEEEVLLTTKLAKLEETVREVDDDDDDDAEYAASVQRSKARLDAIYNELVDWEDDLPDDEEEEDDNLYRLALQQVEQECAKSL